MLGLEHVPVLGRGPVVELAVLGRNAVGRADEQPVAELVPADS